MDIDEIARILELMQKHDLVEVEIEDPENGRIRLLKSRPEATHPVLTPMAMPAMPMAAAPVAAPVPAVSEAPEEEPESANLTEVPSPMVGTFYRATSPESDSFVEVGSTIDEESIVCIIEAMKVMNEIKAEVAGEVVEILVQNGEAVEFGQPLFLIRTE